MPYCPREKSQCVRVSCGARCCTVISHFSWGARELDGQRIRWTVGVGINGLELKYKQISWGRLHFMPPLVDLTAPPVVIGRASEGRPTSTTETVQEIRCQWGDVGAKENDKRIERNLLPIELLA